MAKKNKKIVIVEDTIDKELGELENLLRKKDFFIFHYHTPQEFMDYVRVEKGDYDLAIIDLAFSKGDCRAFYEISGIDAIEIGKNFHKKKPILCRSNYGDPSSIPHTRADKSIIKEGNNANDMYKVIKRLIKKFY